MPLFYASFAQLCHKVSYSECSMQGCYHSCVKNCTGEVAQNQNISARRTEGKKYKKRIKEKFGLLAVKH